MIMNIIHLKRTGQPRVAGDLYLDESDNEVYILATVSSTGKSWVAICLKDGQRWNNPADSIQEAIEGLTPIGRKFTITIEQQ